MQVKRTRVARPSVALARRTRKVATVDVDASYDEVIEKLQLIAEIDAEHARIADAYTKRRAVLEEEVEHSLKASGHSAIDDGVLRAQMVTPPGRSTTYIDPQKFRKYVGDDAFWKCVKVGVTEAKQFVSEKEMPKAGATVTPGQAGKPKLVIERIKKK